MVAEPVHRARQAQGERYGGPGALNGNEPPAVLAEGADLTRGAAEAGGGIAECFGRKHQMRVIRVARTIADLAGRADVTAGNIQEAATHCALLSNAN